MCCDEDDLDECTPCEDDPDELTMVAVGDAPVGDVPIEAQKGWAQCTIEVDQMSTDGIMPKGAKLTSRMAHKSIAGFFLKFFPLEYAVQALG